MTQQFELENQFEEQLELQVQNLLTPVYGAGSLEAAASVTLNFDDEVVESVEFSPPIEGETDGIIVSMSELYENSRTVTDAEGTVGTDSNGVGTVEYPYGTLGEDELYSKVLKEANYEINQTTTQIQRAKGTIRDLSIAILIDSEAIAEDYTENVRSLVSKAIGVSEAYISVERLPFQLTDSEFDAQLAEQNAYIKSVQFKETLNVVLKYAVILALILLAFIFIMSVAKMAMGGRKEETVLATGGSVDYMADEDVTQEVSQYKDVDLNIKSDGVLQLEKFIEKDPAAVAQLLRNWLSDD
jgi:flagellar M-ring protein FliF